ncbi:MAG: hypothetical protein WAQ28_11065 [Bacteroidia bacterium]|jgi:hypothetical protein
MKKGLLFIAVVSAFSFASCKKDRTCTCTLTSDAPGATPTTTMVTYTDAKKGDARAACYSAKQAITGTSYTYTKTCELK